MLFKEYKIFISFEKIYFVCSKVSKKLKFQNFSFEYKHIKNKGLILI